MISKRPKLQRQKRIFKQVMPRAKQMNINIVTWGRWMKQSNRVPSRQNLTLSTPEIPEAVAVRTHFNILQTNRNKSVTERSGR